MPLKCSKKMCVLKSLLNSFCQKSFFLLTLFIYVYVCLLSVIHIHTYIIVMYIWLHHNDLICKAKL